MSEFLPATAAYPNDTKLDFPAGKHAVHELTRGSIPYHLADLILMDTDHDLDYIETPEGFEYAKGELIRMIDDVEAMTGIAAYVAEYVDYFIALGHTFVMVSSEDAYIGKCHALTVVSMLVPVAQAIGFATDIWE